MTNHQKRTRITGVDIPFGNMVILIYTKIFAVLVAWIMVGFTIVGALLIFELLGFDSSGFIVGAFAALALWVMPT